MKLYDGGVIIIVAGLIFLSICYEINQAKREREFWEYIEKIHCEDADYKISSDKKLLIKKATPEDINKFWNGEDINYGEDAGQ